MANAAPYIASPTRRVLAGAMDLALCMFLLLMLEVIVGIGAAASEMDVDFLNPAGLITYAAYHLVFFWLFQGQSPGLSLFHIRVVKATNGEELGLSRALLRSVFRPVALYVLNLGATVLHPIGSATAAIWATPLAIEMGMMFTLPTRQTLTDLVSKTFVVNTPLPQPHRAPAAPMYSETDAEFGVRPRRHE